MASSLLCTLVLVLAATTPSTGLLRPSLPPLLAKSQTSRNTMTMTMTITTVGATTSTTRRSAIAALGAPLLVGSSAALSSPSVASAVEVDKAAMDEAASLVRLGLGEYGKQNFDKAFTYYDKAVAASKGSYAPAYANRANLYILREKLKEALADYDRAVEIGARPGNEKDADRWVVLVNRATTRLAMAGSGAADAQKSVDDLNQAQVLRGKGEVLILSNRGQAYERLGDYNRAVGDYASAVALAPRDLAPFWLRYATCLFEARRDAEAVALARRLRSKFTGEAEVAVALAAMLLASGGGAIGGGEGGSASSVGGGAVGGAVGGTGFQEAAEIYRTLPPIQRQRYASEEFLTGTIRWPPRLVRAALDLSTLFAKPSPAPAAATAPAPAPATTTTTTNQADGIYALAPSPPTSAPALASAAPAPAAASSSSSSSSSGLSEEDQRELEAEKKRRLDQAVAGACEASGGEVDPTDGRCKKRVLGLGLVD